MKSENQLRDTGLSSPPILSVPTIQSQILLDQATQEKVSKYDLSTIEDITTLHTHIEKNQLKQNLVNTYELLKEIDLHIKEMGLQIGNQCHFHGQIFNDSFQSKLALLGSFDDETQKYEDFAIQFYQIADAYFSPYETYFSQPSDNLSDVLSAFNKSMDFLLDSPISPLISKLHKENLSLVFGALCEKEFNSGNFNKCGQLAKKIHYQPALKDDVLCALGRHFIHHLQFDEALIYLKEGGYSEEKEDLILYIAKAFVNQGERKKVLEIAKNMHSGKKKEEFIKANRIKNNML